MVGTFTLAQTNYHGYFNPADCPVERFKPWIRFLNEQCFASTAITADVELQLDPLRDYYSTLFNSTLVDNPRVTGTIRNKNIQITADDVNRILGFPRENFEEVPTKDELIQFFQTIQYQGVIKLSKMLKNKLVPEWDYFFNTMAKVFAPTTSKSFNNITSLLQIIGFCITHNRRINFGRMILITIIKRLGTFASRQLVVDNSVLCYYPRFLMLFLNDTMTAEDKAFYANSPTEQPHPPSKFFFTRLHNSNRFQRVPIILTPYMIEQFQLPQVNVEPEQQQPEQPQHQLQHQPEPQPQQQQQQQPLQQLLQEPVPQPQPIQTEHLPETQSTLQPLTYEAYAETKLNQSQQVLQAAQIISSLSSAFDFKFQTASIDPANIQVHNQANDFLANPNSIPNTSTDTTVPRTRKVAATRSGGKISSLPAALSPLKKRRLIEFETSAASSISSQQDLDTEMAIKQSLDSFPLQVESIEIDHSVAVPCIESSTQLAFTLVNTQLQTQVTTQSESTVLENVMTENLPDPTFSMDKSFFDSFQEHPPSQASEERFVSSLPIASSKGAFVVYTCTAESVLHISDERKTPSDKHAREDSTTTLSVREVSAHTDTYLLQQQLVALKAQLDLVKAENRKLKDGELATIRQKVVEKSSISSREDLNGKFNELSTIIDQNHCVYMDKFENLEASMAKVLDCMQSFKSASRNYDEDPSTKGEKDKKNKGGSSKILKKEATEISNPISRKIHKVRFSQSEDYYEDPEEEEVQFHMTRAESRRKPGEPFLLEEPITDEPPTPVHRNQEVEEGEVVRSDD